MTIEYNLSYNLIVRRMPYDKTYHLKNRIPLILHLNCRFHLSKNAKKLAYERDIKLNLYMP
jgi:hypothetical protein